MTEEFKACPECKSPNIVKMGHVWSGRERRQQYRCQDCGRLTINPIIISNTKGNLVAEPAK